MSYDSSSSEISKRRITVGSVSNAGEPYRFKDVQQLAGITAEAARPGESVKIWTKMALTSDDPLFYIIVESVAGVIRHMAESAGLYINIESAKVVLLVLKPDGSAELWVDTAAVSITCVVRRAVEAGTFISQNEIADIRGMLFPCVEFGDNDKVLCIVREGWRFGLAFDMNPEGKLDLEDFNKTLGTLVREMRYMDLYQALANEDLINRIIELGWFPFVEIINSEFKDLLRHEVSGFGLADIEPSIISNFDQARLEHIMNRWLSKKHFAVKSDLLKEAVDAFLMGKPVTVIKIILTEIEGILNDAYRTANGGQGAKLKQLLAFAEASAEQRAGGSHTLLLPKVFAHYLSRNTFANFDPVAATGIASSRHAVSHGAAEKESYTMVRALQAILTLDQLAFYI